MSKHRWKLDDCLTDERWSSTFSTVIAKAFPVGRRAFLLGGLATLTASGLRFETLSLELRRDKLIIWLDGRPHVVPLAQYGRAARYEVGRDGAGWFFHARALAAAPLPVGSDMALQFQLVRGVWKISGGGALGNAASVPLSDWLAGLVPLAFDAEIAIQSLRYARLSADRFSLALFSDGSWMGRSPTGIGISLEGMRFTAERIHWTQRREDLGGWLFRAEGVRKLDTFGFGAHMPDGRKVGIFPDTIAAFALEETARGRSVLYLECAAALRLESSGRGLDLVVPALRLARVLSQRKRPTQGLASLAGAQGSLDLAGASFAFSGQAERLCRIEFSGGRAKPFALDLRLNEASIPVAGADVSQWMFPGSQLRLLAGHPRPIGTEAEQLYLVASQPVDVADAGSQSGSDPSAPRSNITINGSTESFSIDGDRSLLRVLRVRDLLDLKFGFFGLNLIGDGRAGQMPELTVATEKVARPALVVHFGPQHVYERANDARIVDGQVEWTGDRPLEVVEARASGPSRIVFDLADRTRIPLSISDLTAWSDLTLRVTGRSFKPESDVLEQLEYVGIRPGVMRPRAMELLRSSIERDRDLENPSPTGDQYLETAIEPRYRMIVSPPENGSRPEPVASDRLEWDIRGAQLFSARFRSARALLPAPIDSGPRADATNRAGMPDDAQDQLPPRPALAADEPKDLRVVWARGIDLGFLSGRNIPEEDKAPWTATVKGRPFPAAHSMQDLRELMIQTSVPALNAILGLQKVSNQDDPDKKNQYLEDDFEAVPGQVVPQPPGFTFVDNGWTDAQGKRKPDAGIAVAKTLGPSRLVLTSQGGSFASASDFAPFAPFLIERLKDPNNPPVTPPYDWSPALTMERFDAHSVLGRDIAVTVASKGFLFPFGHRASLVKVSERMFLPHASRDKNAKEQDPTSYLVRRFFIVVGRPDKAFPALGQPFAGRAGLALNSIRILTTRSPDLLNPITALEDPVHKYGRINIGPGLIFWPRTVEGKAGEHGTDVTFEYRRDDEDAILRAPLIFVDNAAAHDAGAMRSLAEKFRGFAPSVRTVLTPGETLRFAPSQRKDETAFETDTLTMAVSGRAAAGTEGETAQDTGLPGRPQSENFTMDGVMEGADQPPFYPIMETARARVQPVNRLLGQPGRTIDLGMNPLYVAKGFDAVANPSQIFLNVKTPHLYLDLSADGSASGGIAKPNMRIAMLSRSVGPIGGPAADLLGQGAAAAAAPVLRSPGGVNAVTAAEAGRFDPADMFGGALNDAKILGLLSLKDVLKVASMATGAPKLLESTVYEFGEAIGGTNLGGVQDIAETAVGVISGVIESFLEDVNGALNELGADLSLAGFYPELDRSLKGVEPAAEAVLDQIARSIRKLADIEELGSEDELKSALTAEYVAITGRIAALVTAVEAVRAAGQAVIDNPVPAIVGEAIDEITSAWQKLHTDVKEKVIGNAWLALKSQIVDGLVADLRSSLPVPGSGAEWVAPYVVYFGFPRRAVQPKGVRVNVAITASELEDDIRRAYSAFEATSGKLAETATQILKHHAESLLAEHFGLPLSRAIQALIDFQREVEEASDKARETLIEKFSDLIVKATQALIDLGYLQQVSDLLAEAEDFCKAATTSLTDAGTGLVANFDLAETELHKAKSVLAKAKVPSQLPDLDAARARALIAINEMLALVAEARLIRADLDKALEGVDCASLTQLDPITQLFRLQSRALDRARDLATAMTDIQSRLVAAGRAQQGAGSAVVGARSELSDMEDALTATIGATKGLLQALVGAFKADDLKSAAASLGPVVNTYKLEVTNSANKIQDSLKKLSDRIDKINASVPKLAVEALNAETQTAIDLIVREINPLLGNLVMAGQGVAGVLQEWVKKFEPRIKQILMAAITIDNAALVAITTIIDTLENDAPALKQLIRQEAFASLTSSRDNLDAEINALNTLNTSFGINDARKFVTDHWIDKPPALLGAVASLQNLAEGVESGRLAALIDIRALRDKLEDAILGILPTRVNLSYDWSTEIGNYPTGKPIFSITEDALENDDYWKVDGPVKGRALKGKFYADPDAQKGKPKNHLVIEAGASIDLLTGDREAYANGYLHPFTVDILPDFKIVTLKFSAATFGGGSGRSSKFRTNPVGVEIGEKLSYISALSGFLSGGGDQGPYYEISLLPPSIEVGYRLSLDQVPLGALMFYNISLNLSAVLPLDDRDARFRFTFARRDLPFIISVPPYGGGGFVGFTANAKGITGFEASVEFGAMVGLAFGPITGYGQITAGIYIARTASGTTIIRGFVRAIGEGSIAIFTLTVYIEISLEQKSGQGMTGKTHISLTFKVKFVEFNYSFDAEYNVSGGDGERFVLLSRNGCGNEFSNGTARVKQPSETKAWNRYSRAYGGDLLSRGWT